MREIATEVEIAASPTKVWEILTDLDRFSKWNPLIKRDGRINRDTVLDFGGLQIPKLSY